MKNLSLFLLTGFLFSQDSFPGGYIGIGTQIGTDLTIGFQVSLGIIEPSLSDRGGPFLSSGAAIGFRYSTLNKNIYPYSDLQITYFGDALLWGGFGYGIAYIDSKAIRRFKAYGGYLMGGLTTEVFFFPKSKYTFIGAHLGIPLPLLGTHVSP